MLPYLKDNDEQTRALIEPLLTGTAANLLRLVGLAATLALVREFGGTDLFFPSSKNGMRSPSYRRLVEIVGPDNALVVTSEYATSDRVYIPRCLPALNACRNAQMIREFDALAQANSASRAYREIARNYRLTVRRVTNIINSKKIVSRAALPRNAAP